MSEIPIEDIQGDILTSYRFPKDVEHFHIFHIEDVEKFRAALHELLDEAHRGHASAKDVSNVREKLLTWDKRSGRMSHSFFNIAFSKEGIDVLGLEHKDLDDKHFRNGQFADATTVLGDPFVEKDGKILPDWEDKFVELELAHKIHGIILVAGEANSVQQHSKEIKQTLAGAASIVYYLEGATLGPKKPLRDQEHFGWRDGISQPFIEGYTTGTPEDGQTKVPPGVIIMGAKGDRKPRPEWALGGSFMVFRKLQQLVPEFHEFLYETGAKEVLVPKDREAAAKLFGSRLIGRWPSGTPLENNPINEPPVPPEKLNSFTYKKVKEPNCPYGAHIRKTNPRNSLDPGATESSSIVRAGIPYGEVVKPDSDEEKKHKTLIDRGLAFVAYQSAIENGFIVQQQAWANDPDFPKGKDRDPDATLPGFDAIIGQRAGKDRERAGIHGVRLPKDFVVPRAGAYFFVPSIPAMHKFFAKV
ncbi:unnamed protein product [Rhizoctonia solani]|uniref:Uncharacterized protein n=1 Tax=Rhizoctonia solani TaxID=456999 RepID=A0A8H2X898_9AGAM|nr:unnamed protein product [Rhizoctonia solani]